VDVEDDRPAVPAGRERHPDVDRRPRRSHADLGLARKEADAHATRPAARREEAGVSAVQAVSVDIGCVRMTERHLHGDPPSGAELAAATGDIDAALDAVTGAVPVSQARTLIGLAGSVTTVAGIAMGLPSYDASRIHHARVSAADVHMVTRSLLAQTRAARAAIGVMHPGRVDVIGGGALILDRIMQRFGFGEVLVSEHDILDGIAWSLAVDMSRDARY